MRASIAISAHNEGELLLKTVQSCLETISDLDCEIVVADDASTDESIDRLKKAYPGVRVYSSPERRGCSATKDLAARSSQGDVLIFLDAHCKPTGDAINRLVEDVEDWNGEAIISPRTTGLNTVTWECGRRTSYIGYWLDLEWFHSGWTKQNELRSVTGREMRQFYEQAATPGCCLAVSRKLYDKLRGFDRDMLSWGMEDLDFGLKGWLMGHSLLVDPEAVIGHRFATGPLEYSVPMEHLLVNRLRVARKNFDDVAWADWCWRHRAYHRPEIWANAWRLFDLGRESVEVEREYLQQFRPFEVYQYAIEFGLSWPLTLRTSPYPAPVVLKRPRYSRPFEDKEVLRTSHEPPDDGDNGGDKELGTPAPQRPSRAPKTRRKRNRG
jgi:GT2 family glycosyltransferase